MNIEKMFEMQKELDERIIKEHGLESQDLLPNTVLALQVEIAELANEWRGFKHWSNNREPGNTLEEYVDCLHFFLSIARQLNLPEDDFCITGDVVRGRTTVLFIELLKNVGMINDIPKKYKQQFLKIALSHFFEIGVRLGFRWEQIEQAYYNKNKVNHERQSTGY